MPVIELTCETIGDLDGGVAGAAINRCINEAIADLLDRADEDKKTRKVTIDLEFEKTGDKIDVYVETAVKLPKYRMGRTDGGQGFKNKQPVVLFRSNNPDELEQPMLEDFADGEINDD